MAKAKKAIEYKPIPTPITENELQAVINDRSRLKTLRAAVKNAEEELDQREKTLIERLQSGAGTTGGWAARIVLKVPVCRLAWKDLFYGLARRFALNPETLEAEAIDEKRATQEKVPALEILDRNDVL